MSKERREIIYSILILILIPLLIVVNVVLLTNNVRRDFDRELSRKADLTNSVLATTLKAYDQADTEQVQVIVSEIAQARIEVSAVRVFTYENGEYRLLARSDSDAQRIDTIQYDIAAERRQSVARRIQALTPSGQSTRAWEVVSPVLDADDQVSLIVSSIVLTTDADRLISRTFMIAYIVVLASVVVVALLLFRHFRLVGYADLLRKQREINQTMTDFLSVATHELKAPMTVIKGYVASMLEGDFGDLTEQSKQPLSTVLTQTERLNNLVIDLLNVSRIEQGRITIEMTNVDIASIIRDIVNQYAQKTAEKNLTIDYQLGEDESVFVYADEGRVIETMTNLIDNAVKYSLQGMITIRHERIGKKLATKVRDTGIGMSNEERKRLFQRFYRVKNDQTREISGTGLGLWIIRKYVELMDGSIAVDSLPGVGSEFTVELRAADIQQVNKKGVSS